MYMHMSCVSLGMRMHVYMCCEPRHVHVPVRLRAVSVLCEPRHVHGRIWLPAPALSVACRCGWFGCPCCSPHSSIAAKLATCACSTAPQGVAPKPRPLARAALSASSVQSR